MARSFKSVVSIDDQASASSEALRLKVTGEANARLSIDAGGKLTWGSGSASGDATLYRSAANALKTDDTFQAALGVITLTTDGAPSSSLADGAVAVDTTNDSLYFRSSSNWQAISNLIISDGVPSGPVAGDLWFESDTGRTFVYYADGSSNQWVEVGSASSSGVHGAAGKVQFSEGNTFASDTLLHWDNTNKRLGIGDTTPDAKLDVYHNTNNEWVAIFDQDHATGYGVKITGDMTATNDALLKIEAGSTQVFRMTQVGLMLGTPTTPTNLLSIDVGLNDTKGLSLDYSGEAKAGMLLNPNSGEVRMGALNSTGDYFVTLYADNAEKMRITAAGLVGIGTAAPNNILHLAGTTANHRLVFTNTANTAGKRGMSIGMDNDRMAFQRTDDSGNWEANYMVIDQDTGNVGIGTTAPTTYSSTSLHIAGSGTDAAIKFTNTSTGAANTDGFDLESNGLDFNFVLREAGALKFWTSTAHRMTLSAAGNLGIGTASPAHPLHVDGFARFDADAGEWAKIYGGGSAGDGAWAQYYDSAANHMGYVGFPANEDLHLQANCTSPSSQIFFRTNSVYCAYFTADGYFLPYTDNVFRAGTSSLRWNQVNAVDVYTHDGGVHTSDVSEKTDVIDTPLGVDFIKELRPVQYRWIDGTRSHQGFIAQDVETILNGTAGTTASDQGMWCAVEVDTTKEVNENVLDGDGNVVGVERTTVPGEQFERQSLRYNELMAPMVKALQEIVTRLEALESA